MEPLDGAGALDVAGAVDVAGGALLSGVTEASTAGVVDAGAGALDATAGTAVAAHEHTSTPAA